jgi:hypothetical protein
MMVLPTAPKSQASAIYARCIAAAVTFESQAGWICAFGARDRNGEIEKT